MYIMEISLEMNDWERKEPQTYIFEMQFMGKGLLSKFVSENLLFFLSDDNKWGLPHPPK